MKTGTLQPASVSVLVRRFRPQDDRRRFSGSWRLPARRNPWVPPYLLAVSTSACAILQARGNPSLRRKNGDRGSFVPRRRGIASEGLSGSPSPVAGVDHAITTSVVSPRRWFLRWIYSEVNRRDCSMAVGDGRQPGTGSFLLSLHGSVLRDFDVVVLFAGKLPERAVLVLRRCII